jgi:hypothetical protein
MGWVVKVTPRTLYPPQCTGGWVGPQGRSKRVRKTSPPPPTNRVSFYHRALCSYLIRACVLVFIVLHFAFLSLLTTHKTSMPRAGFEPATPASDRQQPLPLDGSVTGIGREFDPRTAQPVYRLSYPDPQCIGSGYIPLSGSFPWYSALAFISPTTDVR